METFLVEFDERILAISRDLLGLEATEPGSAERERRLQDLMRNAHSLEGAARAVDVKLIEEACHRFEYILAVARRNPALFEQQLFELLFSVLDGLAEAGKLLAAGEGLEGTLLSGVSIEMELLIEVFAEATRDNPVDIEEPRAAPEAVTPVIAPRAEPVSDSSTVATQQALSVRIDTDKLDNLLSSSADLLGARVRLRATADRLAALGDATSALLADFTSRRQILATPAPTDSAAPQPSLRQQELGDQTPQRLQALRIELDALRSSFLHNWRLLDRAGGVLDEQVRRIRMLPFSYACVGLDRMVRDLAMSAGKDVELLIEGAEVAIDRAVLDGLKEPLRHLIRNAVDHGIEAPDKRKQAGKSTRGRIRASASLRGGQVEVLISDDGRGLAAASQQGVGLDVIRTQLKKLHGEIDTSFTPGETHVRIAVPLTQALLRVLLVRSSGQVFAINNHSIYKLLRVTRSDIVSIGQHFLIHIDNQSILLRTLAQALSLPQPQIADWPGKRPIIVLKFENRLAAFLVDDLLVEQEVTLRSLGSRVQRVPNIAGAVILPEGQVALMLQVAELLGGRGSKPQAVTPLEKARVDVAPDNRRRRILVVDDSMTTRSLERSILETAGFLVDLASDGLQGWERIQAGGIDLVLCDIDMPFMSGYQLTQTIRSSSQFRNLPVILVTSKDDARSKERGLAAGASAYLVKGTFEKDGLLKSLRPFL